MSLHQSTLRRSYLKLLRLKRGFFINFNKTLLKDGIKRVSI
jgi:hypothetical protein